MFTGVMGFGYHGMLTLLTNVTNQREVKEKAEWNVGTLDAKARSSFWTPSGTAVRSCFFFFVAEFQKSRRHGRDQEEDASDEA
ncbi:hypothetical protein QE152_g16008 [Popillia japonica]|uniref:Uncharacterized protein n=1 Tax=Popillia japonica TaxID=7064 RepID=A0AAW1L6T2_POPJA